MAKKKKKKTTGSKGRPQVAKNGRQRCQAKIRGKDGTRQCNNWAAPGSTKCRRHGAAVSESTMEKSVDEGKHLRENPTPAPVGLRRAVSGRFAQLWEQMLIELGDDDLSHELATLRTVLGTQLEETSSRYDHWKEEASQMDAAERVEYWRAYNVMLTRVRQTVDAIRKVVETVANVRHKQDGNTLTMVQVMALVGELVTVMTEIIGDDTDKLETLRSAIDRLEWLPQ